MTFDHEQFTNGPISPVCTGQHERAVQLAYKALAVYTRASDRDRILVNIAAGLRYLGLHDARATRTSCSR